MQDIMTEIMNMLQIPTVLTERDLVEIVIITFLIYQILLWIKNTRAWMLLKGIIVLLAFTLFCAIFQLNTLLWIIDNTVGVGITAVLIIFQPELRKVLEQLGSKSLWTDFLSFEDNREKNNELSDKTIAELVKASFELGKAKTGALMVIEKTVSLSDYERTGIDVDGLVTSQLLINIFEHNTPLHDGAVIIRGNRVTAATCYLPLSDNMMISKELGTRHRAAVGISEVTDSLTIIASEETGAVSLAQEGGLKRNVTPEELKAELQKLQHKSTEAKRFKILKGRLKNEGKADK